MVVEIWNNIRIISKLSAFDIMFHRVEEICPPWGTPAIRGRIKENISSSFTLKVRSIR